MSSKISGYAATDFYFRPDIRLDIRQARISGPSILPNSPTYPSEVNEATPCIYGVEFPNLWLPPDDSTSAILQNFHQFLLDRLRFFCAIFAVIVFSFVSFLQELGLTLCTRNRFFRVVKKDDKASLPV